MIDKILFLHIPKTAGSSFNHVFKKIVPEDRYFEHMESRSAEIEPISRIVRPFFLSGHFTFEQVTQIIERRDVFSVSIVRYPAEQFVSHLNWVKYVGSPQFSNPGAIPDAIMSLAKPLFETPLSEVNRIAELIDTATGRKLFDNLQVRYLMSGQADDVGPAHVEAALKNIRRMSFVFPLAEVDRALAMLRQQFPKIGALQRLNEARIRDEFELDR